MPQWPIRCIFSDWSLFGLLGPGEKSQVSIITSQRMCVTHWFIKVLHPSHGDRVDPEPILLWEHSMRNDYTVGMTSVHRTTILIIYTLLHTEKQFSVTDPHNGTFLRDGRKLENTAITYETWILDSELEAKLRIKLGFLDLCQLQYCWTI